MSRLPLPLRQGMTQGLLLLVLLAGVFPGFFLRGEMIAPGDLLFRIPPWSHYAPEGYEGPQNPLMSDVITAFFPYYALTSMALEEGAWPLWNPLEFGGMPLLANCQTAIFYPPRLLHSLFELRLATSLYIVLKLWLCGMAAFFCARALRFDLWLARFFSLGWMLASYNLIWANWSLPDVSVWLPVLFLGVEWILQQHYRRGILVLGLGGAMILLAGHPETAFGMSLGLGIYFLTRLVAAHRAPAVAGKILAACAAGWALALAVCMMQLLPFIEYLLNSATFFDRPEEQHDTYLPLHALAEFFAPRFFGTSSDGNYWGDINSNIYGMIYPGVAVWAGIFLLLTPGRLELLRRQQCLGLISASACGVLLAFSIPPFDQVHTLPVFSSMIRAYHIAFTVFALPLLAMIGLEHWLGAPRRVRQIVWLLPGAAVAGLVLGYNYSFFSSLMSMKGVLPYVRLQLLIAGGLALASLVMIAATARKPRWLLPAMCLLLSVDLIYLNREMSPTLPRDRVFPRTDLTDFLKSLGDQRISIAEGNVPSGLFATYGIEEWLAYDGLYPARMYRFQTELGPDVWKAMEPTNSKAFYLYDPRFQPEFPLKEPGYFEKVAEHDGLEVYRNLRAFPRAYLVPGLELVADREALFERLKSPEYRPGEIVLALDSPEARAAAAALGDAAPAPDRAGTAAVPEHMSTFVRVEVEAAAPAVLVLSDALYPGWNAYLDGKPAALFPAYEVFKALSVPAGNHTVEFRYEPRSFYLGLGISTATLAATLLWLLPGLVFQRP